ncbi:MULTISPECIES: prohibitin family protein [Oceanibaculum]|uniref:Membrane protease subunit, stomatin/prohibitin n=2 Tax=Oceanibaculum indicum TaxID=526216 RepID=K2IQ74_9PROT|nr:MULTISPECIES: prohibitin family protein [Oceanibaculum]EKE72311.1 membrane protease subunit, stomatin/prohibitin [Oceanibaculum indicum P24]MCH2394308.1 prohibitin family protein [Oceanibaculum sp.]RKQ70074.1 regulator of protease activity HflC (stomatin/prohibitin superfamily) [Oceanibaculum indicum]
MSDDIEEDYIEEADSRRFHRRTVAALLLIALLIASVLLWSRIVVSIRSGEAGVLYRFFSGTEMEQIYDEGVHLLWPWDRMFIYDMRLQTKEREYSLLTSSGLPVDLNVAVRYRPDIRMLPLLHVAVGPEYLEKVVFPETEAVLRRAVGQYGPEEVYTSKRGFLESIVVSSLSKVESRYVLIDDVLVKSVDLPVPVRDAIEQKLVLGEQEKAYQYRLAIEHKEAERKKIEAGGIQEYQRRVGETLTQDLLRWQGIQATRELATSNNAKTVVIGAGKDGLPIILGDR